jgi:hypothetical protein
VDYFHEGTALPAGIFTKRIVGQALSPANLSCIEGLTIGGGPRAPRGTLRSGFGARQNWSTPACQN